MKRAGMHLKVPSEYSFGFASADQVSPSIDELLNKAKNPSQYELSALNHQDDMLRYALKRLNVWVNVKLCEGYFGNNQEQSLLEKCMALTTAYGRNTDTHIEEAGNYLAEYELGVFSVRYILPGNHGRGIELLIPRDAKIKIAYHPGSNGNEAIESKTASGLIIARVFP